MQPFDCMKIFIGSDHAGFETKEFIKNTHFSTINEDVEFIDAGTYTKNRCDYPDYAKKTVKLLKKHLPFRKTSEQNNFGVLICGTGFGMCMVANRYKKIRAVVCRNVDEAKISRQHNNANVLCLGERTTTKEEIIEIINAFISTKYEGGRHNNRIKKFSLN